MANDDDMEVASTTVVLILLVVCVSLVGFGLANWSCYVTPTAPMVQVNTTKEQVQAQTEVYQNRADAAMRGDGAVVPFAAAPPMVFGGLTGAFICLCVMIRRYGT